AGMIVWLAARVDVVPEQAGMHIGARAGEENAVDDIKERADVGDLGRTGKHQRQRAGGLGDRAQITLAHPLRRILALHQVQAADQADDGFVAAHLTASALTSSLMRGYHQRAGVRRSPLGRPDPPIANSSLFSRFLGDRRYSAASMRLVLP